MFTRCPDCLTKSSHLPAYRLLSAMLCAIAMIWCLSMPAHAEITPGSESPYMQAIRGTIERSVSDKSCLNHSDCGAAVLLNRNGCRMYTPFSLRHVNEQKIQALLQAYNGLAQRSRRDAGLNGGCSRNVSEPDTVCERNRLQARGVCAFRQS